MGSDPVFLTREQVLALHDRAIRDYGGRAWLVDEGRLESALGSPAQTFGGDLLYRTLHDIAAAYWHGLTMDHPFSDGNKRVGLAAASVFLRLNGHCLTFTQLAAERISIQVAQGLLDREELATMIEANMASIEPESIAADEPL